MMLPAVIADRIRGDEQTEDDAPSGETAEQPTPEAVRGALRSIVPGSRHASSSLHRVREHDGHRYREERGEAAGDQAEPRRAETCDEAKRGHADVVESMVEGMTLERLVEARDHPQHRHG